MKKIVLAIAALAAFGTNAAFAQGYVGGSVGASHANIDCAGATDCSNNSTGFKIFGGYKFTPNIAGELSYVDLGKAHATVAPDTVSIKSTGLGIGVAAFADFAPQWKGVGRLGILSSSTKATVSGSVNGSDTDRNTNAYLGLGIGYEIQKGLTLDGTLDFTRIKYSSESANVRVLSVGLTYAF
jgi:OOP family OmpA-OmpF porin